MTPDAVHGGSVLAVALALLALVLVAYLARRRRAATPPLLYLDEGAGSRVFASPRYRLRAKPDKLEGRASEATLVELKSRRGGVHERDVAQMIATALAVRAGGIRVTRARLETRASPPAAFDLSASDEALFERIRPAVEAARLAARGIAPPPRPSGGKCRACGYRERCPHRADGGRRSGG